MAKEPESKEAAALQGLGWMYTEACVMLDKGNDLREVLVPDLAERCMHDLGINFTEEKANG